MSTRRCKEPFPRRQFSIACYLYTQERKSWITWKSYIKMTERHSHLMPDVKKRAVQALEGAFREANGQSKVVELKTEEEG